MAGKLIVVIGGDASGKSTLLGGVATARPHWRTMSASPEDLYPIDGLDYMNWTLARHPREFLPAMRPLTRAAFFATTLAIEYEYHLAPAISRGATVVCDSYHYRFVAKEKVLNPRGARWLETLVAALPVPDLVIELAIHPERAWTRRQQWSAYDAPSAGDRGAFIAFQQEVMMRVRQAIAGCPLHVVDADRERDAVLADVLAAIESTCAA